MELTKEFKDIEIKMQKLENKEKLETLKMENNKKYELQKIENEKKLFDVRLENKKKIEKFIFEFLNKMVKEGRTPEEIMLARSILLQGMDNDNLVNLYEGYNPQTPYN